MWEIFPPSGRSSNPPALVPDGWLFAGLLPDTGVADRRPPPAE